MEILENQIVVSAVSKKNAPAVSQKVEVAVSQKVGGCCIPKSGEFLAGAESFENNRCQKVVFVNDFFLVVV